MPMIQLHSLPCDDFKLKTEEYLSCPSASVAARIQWIETEITQRTNDFLADPTWYINEWEQLTEEDIPSKYTEEFALEISHLVSSGGKRKHIAGYAMSLLPLLDAKGNTKSYPEDRLVEDFLKFNQKVYILNDSIYKQVAMWTIWTLKVISVSHGHWKSMVEGRFF